MAPIPSGVDAKTHAQSLINGARIRVFSKTTCPFCDKVKAFFKEKYPSETVDYVELDTLGEDGQALQNALQEISGQRTVPNVFINGKHLGGCDDTLNAGPDKLVAMLSESGPHSYDYDIIVIGGGSGGLAASKEAARLGKKVAVCDFVVPSPPGTKWGLGGTCVNVGCIPKKLMHQAGILGELQEDAGHFGWNATAAGERKCDWAKMVEAIQNHIGSLNWGYRVALRDKNVKYFNEYASFQDPHTLKTVNKKGKETMVTAKNFILATGGRPRYPDIPGAKEFGITSDDIFSLPYNPGKTLLVGASYIALECAGFLHGVGIRSTVMVRSILLRGFDQQISNKIGAHMEEHGINFVRECVPTRLERVEEGNPGTIKVFAKYADGTEFEDVFNTVIFAIGRDAETTKIGLDKAGVQVNPKNQKVLHDENEKTSADHIYAIGDILDAKPELTPVAIQAGVLLARRMSGISDVKTNYVNIATTVFTPLEYGCVGLSEEDAIKEYGEDGVEIFHKNFQPLEWTVAKRKENDCYAKLCVRKSDDLVVGLHYLGPNAGEVTQGYAGMVMMGARKSDFDNLIGIHPTTAEWFTTMDVTKSSGVDPSASGC